MRADLCRLTLFATALAAVPGQTLAIEPADIRLGPMTFTPSLLLSERYDDNFRAVAEPDAESSWITTLAPTFVLGAQDRLNLYTLSYRPNAEFYHGHSEENNTDHHFDADAHMEFGSRHRLDLSAGYDRVETTVDSTSATENDKFHNTGFEATYGFGAESATMQIELGAGHDRKRYDNSGDLNSDKEHDADTLSATAYYRLAPRTRALVETVHRDFDYVSRNSLDSDSQSYLAGVTLDATARTSGIAKIGRETKNFDSPEQEDPSVTTWEVGLTWKPRSYSSLTLKTRQGIDEGSIEENFIEARRSSLNWRHRWNAFFTTDLSYSTADLDYDNAANRRDEVEALDLGLTYDMRRWLSLELEYRFTDRDSNVARENYERNQYLARLNISL